MKATDVREEVVTVEQLALRYSTVAKVLDCSESTVRKLAKAGKLEVIKIGGDDRITAKSVKAFTGAAA